MSLLLLLPARADAAPTSSPYSWTLSSTDVSAFDTAIPKNGVNWIVSKTGAGSLQNYDNTKGKQFGSSKSPVSTLTFTSTGFAGLSISEVKVNTSGASGTNATVSVKIGEDDYVNGSSTSVKLTTSATEYSFKPSAGSAVGEVSIQWSVTEKAVYVKSIEVTYTDQVIEKKDVVLTAVAAAPELEAGSVMSFSDFVEATVDGASSDEAAASVFVKTGSDADNEFVEIDNDAKTIKGLKATSGPVTLYAYVPASDKFNATAENVPFNVTVKAAAPKVPGPVMSVPVADAAGEIALDLGKSVTFTSENASKLRVLAMANNDDNASAFNGDFDGDSWTFTPVAEDTYILSVTALDSEGNESGDALEVTVNVTKVPAPLCGDIVFSLAGGEVKAGTVVTVSCENAAMIKYTVNGGEVNTAEGDSFDYTVNEASAIKAWGVNADGIAGAEAVVNYTIKQSTSTVYTLVTSADDIADGDKVLVVTKNGNDYYAMTNSLLSSKITSNSVTVTDGVVELEDGQTSVEVLTVEEGADSDAEKYALKGTKGYVTSTSSTNTSFGTSAYYSDVKITANGVTTWYVNSTRVLSGYSGANGVDFRAYQPANAVLDIYLFREGAATPKTKVTLGVKEGVNTEIGVGETLAAGWLSATVDGEENAEALAAVSYSVTEGADVVTVAADGAITAGENPGTAKVTATIANNKLFELVSEPVVLDVTVVETKCKAPVLKVGETVLADNAELTVGDVITITTATEGAALFYSTQNGPDHEYDVENGLKLGFGTYTITATAKKEGLENASVTLTGVKVSKKAPEIGFADAERTVYLSDFVEAIAIAEHDFINRNNLPVVFTSSDPKVASIDETTGDIQFWNQGVTTISAAFAGNDEYEALTVDYKLNVNLTRPAGESFTLEFTLDPNGGYSNSGTDLTAATAISDVLKTGADKVASFTDFARVKYNSRLGLRMGTNDNPGNITINFNETLRITQLKAYVAKWTSDNVTFLLINDKRSDIKEVVGTDKTIDEQERTYNYDVPMETDALTLRTIDTSYEEVQSPSKRIFIKALDITVESGLNAPVPFDEGGYVIPRSQFNNVETDFIRFEHEAGVDIFYRYTGGAAGDPNVKPNKAPARAEEAAETATHPDAEGETFTKLATDTSVTDKTTGKYYPYGENYEQWQGGVLKVFAQKTAEDGTVQRSPIHTFNLAIPTSVEGIEAEGNGEVEYFNLQGVKVQNPEKGIYIRVQDGKAVKIAK